MIICIPIKEISSVTYKNVVYTTLLPLEFGTTHNRGLTFYMEYSSQETTGVLHVILVCKHHRVV